MAVSHTKTDPVNLIEAWEMHAERWLQWARTPGHHSYWRYHHDRFLRLPSSSACGRFAHDAPRENAWRRIAIDPGS